MDTVTRVEIKEEMSMVIKILPKKKRDCLYCCSPYWYKIAISYLNKSLIFGERIVFISSSVLIHLKKNHSVRLPVGKA